MHLRLRALLRRFDASIQNKDENSSRFSEQACGMEYEWRSYRNREDHVAKKHKLTVSHMR